MKFILKVLPVFFVILGYSEENIFQDLDNFLSMNNVPEEKNAGHIRSQEAKIFHEIIKMHPHKIQKVAEIGFCLGHSSESFLTIDSDITVVSFDMMYNWWNDLGKQYIDWKYPNRHQLVRGDSTKTVPEFINKNTNEIFDLIFIDGGHEYHVALQDIMNMKHLANSNTLLIVDDIEFNQVNDAWDFCVRKGIVEEIGRYTGFGLGCLVGRYIE